MKKETKRVNKKVLVLGLVLLSLIALNLILIYAADAATPSNPTDWTNDTFFGRWMNSAFKGSDAKFLLWLMLFVVLLIVLISLGLNMGFSMLISIPASFILIAYVTPDSIIGIFRSYETLPLVFATFLPLAILFAFTYLSVVKASRTLMTTQWLLWLIYLSFGIIKIILSLWVYNEGSYYQYLSIAITLPPEAESFWYWASTGTSVIVAGIMVIGSGAFMNWAVRKTIGLENSAATAKFKEATNALKSLAEIEKDLSK